MMTAKRRFMIFFINGATTTVIYTLSLHDALPIFGVLHADPALRLEGHRDDAHREGALTMGDRKSTRLNSSHGYISYAVFCLKKKIRIHYVTICRSILLLFLQQTLMRLVIRSPTTI